MFENSKPTTHPLPNRDEEQSRFDPAILSSIAASTASTAQQISPNPLLPAGGQVDANHRSMVAFPAPAISLVHGATGDDATAGPHMPCAHPSARSSTDEGSGECDCAEDDEIAHETDSVAQPELEQPHGLPGALELDVASIPHHLRTLARFALWRRSYNSRTGEYQKTYFHPSGKRIDDAALAPDDLVTFDAAAQAYATGGYNGVALGWSDELGLACLILNCQPLENGQWPGETLEVLERFNTYTTLASDGQRLRLICGGTWPAHALVNPNVVSVATEENWVILTNPAFPERFLTIEERGAELAAFQEHFCTYRTPRSRSVLPSVFQLSRTRLLDKARSHPQDGARFKALFDDGDVSTWDGDYRAAALWLSRILAYYPGRDAEAMEALFRTSALFRTFESAELLWNERYHLDGRTFGQGVMEAAIQECTEVFGGTFTLEAADLSITPGLAPNDIGNGRRFAAQHQPRARFCIQSEEWMTYHVNNGSWLGGSRGQLEAETLAKLTAESMIREAANTPANAGQKEMLQHAQKSQGVGCWGKMLKAARTEPNMRVEVTEFDQDPWLLHVTNGCLDLRTGKLRPNDPAHLFTHLAPVVFDPNARCPLFKRFLHGIFAGDKEMIAFVRRVLGSSLTGVQHDQRFFMLQGGGANGKTTLLQTVRTLLGDYAHEIDPELLLVEDGERRFETAHLVGKRLVVTSESELDARLHEGRMKRWTGGELLTGEFKFQNSFTFKPQFKLMLNTNSLPELRGTDHGIARRPIIIPFTQKFWKEDDEEVEGEERRPELKADEKLPDKLLAEAPGILNWMLVGTADWQNNGLRVPQAARQAKTEYLREQDVLAPFFQECCVFGAYQSSGQNMYDAYKSWCRKSNVIAQSQPKFARALKARGLSNRHTRSGSVWEGIGLVQ